MDCIQRAQALSSKAGQAPLLLMVLIMQDAGTMALWGKHVSVFGNAKDIKQEWDAFQRGVLPNVYLKPTD